MEQEEDENAEASSSLALVPFTYCNNFIDPLQVETRMFCFPGLDNSSITIKQKWEAGGKGGTQIGFGASVYNASYVLSYFLSNNIAMRDKCIIELGCGPGLASIVAGHSRAKKVVATDGDKISVDLCNENIELNDVSNNVSATRLLWGTGNCHHDNETLQVRTKHFGSQIIDYIIASDVVALPYEDAYGDLLYTLEELCTLGTTEIILVYQKRHVSENAFFDEFNSKFLVKRLPRTMIPEDFRSQPICIYRAVLKESI